jgi:hypothetical protein
MNRPTLSEVIDILRAESIEIQDIYSIVEQLIVYLVNCPLIKLPPTLHAHIIESESIYNSDNISIIKYCFHIRTNIIKYSDTDMSKLSSDISNMLKNLEKELEKMQINNKIKILTKDSSVTNSEYYQSMY